MNEAEEVQIDLLIAIANFILYEFRDPLIGGEPTDRHETLHNAITKALHHRFPTEKA